jgi:outer membrane protein assembly factor BamB
MALKSCKSELIALVIACASLLLPLLLYAQPGTAHRRWAFFIEKTRVQSPAVGSDGTIYIGTGLSDSSRQSDGVYAVNPDGTLKWKVTLGMSVHSSIALDQIDNLYFMVGNANNPDKMDAALYSLNALGQLRWKFEHIGWLAEHPNSGFTPAIARDGTIYAVGRYSLFALDPNGTMKWKYDFPLVDQINQSGANEAVGNQRSAPTIATDGTIYVNTMQGGRGHTQVQGGLYAFTAQGTLKWRTYDLGGYAAAVIGGDGTIYSAIGRYENYADTSDWTAASRDAKLLALNPDGTLKWSVQTQLWIEASPSIGADGTLYVGTTHHPLNKPAWFYAISSEGQIKWKYDTYDDVKFHPSAQRNPPDIYNSPAIDANGRVYFGNELGLFYAMNPDGKVAWIEDISSLHYGSPALVDDGTMYVATHEKIDPVHYALLAINTGSRGLADSPWPKFRQNNANTGIAQAPAQSVLAEPAGGPHALTLYPNYPNPFNPSTTISYSLPAPGFVNLAIFNLSGQHICQLVNDRRGPGLQLHDWDGTDDSGGKVVSGVYICRIEVSSGEKFFQHTSKLCLIQ